MKKVENYDVYEPIEFVTIRHRMIRIANDICKNEKDLEWCIGDMYHDWNKIALMNDEDELRFQICKGHTYPLYHGEIMPNEPDSIVVKVYCIGIIPGIVDTQYLLEIEKEEAR